MTIGEVLVKLRPDFPDVTISKIRFLESEGLIEPARTASGYRKFTYADVERLRFVLRAQRDQYLPLRVIREHLDGIDGSAGGGRPGAGAYPRPRPLGVAGGPSTSESSPEPVRLTRQELLERSGLGEVALEQLESYGMLTVRGGRAPYDGDALEVAKLVAELTTYGLEPRHLRAAKTAADREVGLVEQVVAPLLRRHPQGRARAEQTAGEIASLSARLQAALVRSELNAWLGR